MSTHLSVDREACAGHGVCFDVSPDLLDADEQGDPVVLVDPLGDDQVAEARHVAEVCPERALHVVERSEPDAG